MEPNPRISHWVAIPGKMKVEPGTGSRIGGKKSTPEDSRPDKN